MRTRAFQGNVLRAARLAKKLSQSQLGGQIGAHVTSVSDWERGDNAPSGRHVASLARELGVPVEKFYGDDEDEEAAQTMPLASQQFLVDLHSALGALLDAAAVA